MRRLPRNPDHGTIIPKLKGYKDLGWQRYDYPEVKASEEAGHETREEDNSLHLYRCTDVLTICDEGKWFYHIDMSD